MTSPGLRFFTSLPPRPPTVASRRTFIVLPPAPQKRPSAQRSTSAASVPTGHANHSKVSSPVASPQSMSQSKSQPPSRPSSPAPEPESQPVPPTAPAMSALTRYNHDFRTNFIEQRNGIAPDEVQAHMGMFEVATNDGYYEMGLKVAQVVREAFDDWHKRNTKSQDSTQISGESSAQQRPGTSASTGDLISLDDRTTSESTEVDKPEDTKGLLL